MVGTQTNIHVPIAIVPSSDSVVDLYCVGWWRGSLSSSTGNPFKKPHCTVSSRMFLVPTPAFFCWGSFCIRVCGCPYVVAVVLCNIVCYQVYDSGSSNIVQRMVVHIVAGFTEHRHHPAIGSDGHLAQLGAIAEGAGGRAGSSSSSCSSSCSSGQSVTACTLASHTHPHTYLLTITITRTHAHTRTQACARRYADTYSSNVLLNMV